MFFSVNFSGLLTLAKKWKMFAAIGGSIAMVGLVMLIVGSVLVGKASNPDTVRKHLNHLNIIRNLI